MNEPRSPRRWKCVCAYDGTAFAGWQSQAPSASSGRVTSTGSARAASAGSGRAASTGSGRAGPVAIQDVIEARLAQILKVPLRIHGSGRTDAGVHALGQVFHFDADWRHDPEKLIAAFRFGLPATIQIKSVRAVAPDFHARFGARIKRYVYHVQLGDADPFLRPYRWSVYRPMNVAAMQSAAHVLRGRHDFRSFTALNGPEREDTIRDLRRLEVRQRGRQVTITAEADGFLYKMMRSLAGVLVAVGEGKLTPAQVKAILHARERTAAVLTAPPHGLFLVKVFY